MARTLNLYDGLEALYYFDTDYFDDGTNEISDRSGYGRHATAIGGPSIGVNGPDGFEAASFDGTDDYVDYNGTGLGAQSEFSFHFTVRISDLSDETYLLGASAGDLNYFRVRNDGLEVFDGSNLLRDGSFSSADDNSWLSLTAVYSQGQNIGRLHKNDEIRGISTPTDSPTFGQLTIADRDADGSNAAEMDVALFGFWTRALSETEATYLNRLTGPRRAQL